MQKLRIRYAKRGRLRFTSHRDVARTFERALRRAGVPMAYSQGFNPRPKVSWIGAAPTGTASEAEYVEVSVVDRIDAAALAEELDTALPPGLDVIEAVEAESGSLADRIDGCRWRIELPGVDPDELGRAVELLLAAPEVVVQKLTKDGRKDIDARAAIVSAEVVREVEVTTTRVGDGAEGTRRCGILSTVVRQTQPVVRPDDVLSALRVVADLQPPVPAKAIRMAQGRLDDSGALTDPFANDREPTRATSGLPAVGE
ncbi:TIGR03936 family radical SAM-associated protein [Allokutzneria sp. NRRL B-24872]|uniref:TIGR03936 family radical SAM-associated protein n=1 Tax=Allokutzneria sp. NRRL B-24872 TaxID=1137961 RepID=UPI000A3BAA9E|nr:TIGR03936 family radical SAM-associated protein [Allokutzneria sp. NRRL B-24872]